MWLSSSYLRGEGNEVARLKGEGNEVARLKGEGNETEDVIVRGVN